MKKIVFWVYRNFKAILYLIFIFLYAAYLSCLIFSTVVINIHFGLFSIILQVASLGFSSLSDVQCLVIYSNLILGICLIGYIFVILPFIEFLYYNIGKPQCCIQISFRKPTNESLL